MVRAMVQDLRRIADPLAHSDKRMAGLRKCHGSARAAQRPLRKMAPPCCPLRRRASSLLTSAPSRWQNRGASAARHCLAAAFGVRLPGVSGYPRRAAMRLFGTARRFTRLNMCALRRWSPVRAPCHRDGNRPDTRDGVLPNPRPRNDRTRRERYSRPWPSRSHQWKPSDCHGSEGDHRWPRRVDGSSRRASTTTWRLAGSLDGR